MVGYVVGNEAETRERGLRRGQRDRAPEFYIILFITKCNESRSLRSHAIYVLRPKTSGEDNSCFFFYLIILLLETSKIPSCEWETYMNAFFQFCYSLINIQLRMFNISNTLIRQVFGADFQLKLKSQETRRANRKSLNRWGYTTLLKPLGYK